MQSRGGTVNNQYTCLSDSSLKEGHGSSLRLSVDDVIEVFHSLLSAVIINLLLIVSLQDLLLYQSPSLPVPSAPRSFGTSSTLLVMVSTLPGYNGTGKEIRSP